MNLDQIIQALKSEKDRIERALLALEGSSSPVASVTKPTAIPEIKKRQVSCPDCGLTSTKHGMAVHRSKIHGELSKRPSQVHARQVKPSDKLVRCIDCGKGPMSTAQLETHLATCEAYALANRSNGKH